MEMVASTRSEPEAIWDLLPWEEREKRYDAAILKVEEEIVAFDLEHGYDRKRGSYVDPDLEQVNCHNQAMPPCCTLEPEGVVPHTFQGFT